MVWQTNCVADKQEGSGGSGLSTAFVIVFCGNQSSQQILQRGRARVENNVLEQEDDHADNQRTLEQCTEAVCCRCPALTRVLH